MTREELDQAQWELDFEVSKSMRYHAYRRSFWERWDYGTKLLTMVSGTAVLVSIIGESNVLAKVSAVVVTAAGIADVVLGFSSKVRKHDSLYREFSQLAQQLVAPFASAEELHDLRRKRLQIEMEEPGIADWLEKRCAGEECRARGCDVRDAWKLNRFQIIFSQWAWWPAKL